MLPGDLEQNMRETIRHEAEVVRELEGSLDYSVMLKMLTALEECSGNIILSGCGTSGAAGKKIVHTLNCIGRPAVFLEPSDALHGGLGLLRKEDILILLSNGGETEELLAMLPARRQKGTMLITVSGNSKSTLAQEADIFLCIYVEKEAGPHNMYATASILAVLSAFDALAMTIAVHTSVQRESFGIIHPGGAVGTMLAEEKNKTDGGEGNL